MRTSTRIRNLLIGFVSAAALTTGALAMTATAASAATTSTTATSTTTPRYGCHGYGCTGTVAQVQNCSSDAKTAYAISVYDGLRHTRVTLRLRYSNGCDSAWATVTDTNHPDGATFWIYDRGTHALEVGSTEPAWFTRQWAESRMVGIARTKAQACLAIPERHGLSKPVCTPFFGH